MRLFFMCSRVPPDSAHHRTRPHGEVLGQPSLFHGCAPADQASHEPLAPVDFLQFAPILYAQLILSHLADSGGLRLAVVSGLLPIIARAPPVCQGQTFTPEGLEEFLSERLAAELPSPAKDRLRTLLIGTPMSRER